MDPGVQSTWLGLSMKISGVVAVIVGVGLGLLVLKRRSARAALRAKMFQVPTTAKGWDALLPDRSTYKPKAPKPVGVDKDESAPTRVLCVGITGGTGLHVLKGFVEAIANKDALQYVKPVAMTRSLEKPTALSLERQGAELVKGDLDDEATLLEACSSVDAIYLHGTSADAATADPVEVERAVRLLQAALKADVQFIVFNSAGGVERDSGIPHIEQKGMIEEIIRQSGIPYVMLRATLFMEELWKKYTRPKIIEGTFQFAMTPEHRQQYISCRDMGFAAALCMLEPKKFKGMEIELAADELSSLEVAKAFSDVQTGNFHGKEVVYKSVSPYIFWLISEDLFNIIMWYRNKGYKANVEQCRGLFPGMFTFVQFLVFSGWHDSKRMYDDLAIDSTIKNTKK